MVYARNMQSEVSHNEVKCITGNLTVDSPQVVGKPPHVRQFPCTSWFLSSGLSLPRTLYVIQKSCPDKLTDDGICLSQVLTIIPVLFIWSPQGTNWFYQEQIPSSTLAPSPVDDRTRMTVAQLVNCEYLGAAPEYKLNCCERLFSSWSIVLPRLPRGSWHSPKQSGWPRTPHWC